MTETFAELRRRDFSRLDAQGHVYLDYTGAGLYAESQVRAHADYLCHSVLGNPHSRNPTSQAAKDSASKFTWPAQIQGNLTDSVPIEATYPSKDTSIVHLGKGTSGESVGFVNDGERSASS